MKYIDITKTIYTGMVKYSTDPEIKVNSFKSLSRGNSCNLSMMEFGSHTGTHIDAPLHIFAGGKSVDRIWVGDMMCEVFVTDIRHFFKGRTVQRPGKRGMKGVIFKGGRHGARLNIDEVSILLRLGIKIIGTDDLSIEDPADRSHPVHKMLLSSGIVIVEGLDLKKAKSGCYKLICLPLKIKNGDGAPARAVLVGPIKPKPKKGRSNCVS